MYENFGLVEATSSEELAESRLVSRMRVPPCKFYFFGIDLL
jgi:hypothetical protein